MIRCTIMSTGPPKYPEIPPIVSPRTKVIARPTMPMESDTRVP